jgi:hypothetical protein
MTYGPELERHASRNRQADTPLHCDNGFHTITRAPHFTLSGNNVPQFINRPMNNRQGYFACRQTEMRHASARTPEKQANL